MCFHPQGEQCNIVPDNVDDIVADIAHEDKEEGERVRQEPRDGLINQPGRAAAYEPARSPSLARGN